VLQVYLCRRHVTGLIHGVAAGADASCIYLELFSFSLLCTIEYTHTVLPNFHIVTGSVEILIARSLYSKVQVHSWTYIRGSRSMSLYVLYACMHTQLASPAESGISS